jgi:hypothetical protein
MLYTEIFEKPFLILPCRIIIEPHVVYSYNSSCSYRQSFSFCILNYTTIVVVMPRRTELSKFEKGQIQAFQEIGLNTRDITTRLGPSPTAVDNFIKKKDGYGKKKRSGRQPKLSDRYKRSIMRATSISAIGVRWVRNECRPNVSKNTTWRAIKSAPHLTRQKLTSNSKLKPEHEAKRIHFAYLHVTLRQLG